jgi:glycosyltransferase involved in cell wall biosynthesis
VLDAASVVVLPSGGYRRESTALAGVQTPTRVIGNGAPLPDTRPVAAVREALGVDPDRYVVAFVGVHERWKGVDVLIDAFAALASDDTRPRPLLVVMGTGAETEALRDRARRLGVGDAVRFAGYVPEATKRSYLRAADVCAVPTRVAGAEMSPLVLGEAAAAGTALVASDFPALRDALADREPAVFVDPDDPAALAAALRDLRADPGRRERLAAAGLAHARATPWGDAAAAYLSLYREVVDGG